MRPWYKIVELRREVREGRSFSPDEFAIALEQVVAGTAPRDYRDPEQFFSRTCFTSALTLDPEPEDPHDAEPAPPTSPIRATLRVTGTLPPTAWNRFGTKVLPKLHACDSLSVGVELQANASGNLAASIEADLLQAVNELNLNDQLQVEREESPDSE